MSTLKYLRLKMYVFSFRMNKRGDMFRDACIPHAMKNNKRKTSTSQDDNFKCIFGDLDNKDVEIHSQKYTVSLNGKV